MKLFAPGRALAAVLLAVFVPSLSWAQQGGGYGGGYGGGWGPHMMWGGGWFGGGFMIIFWVLVLVAIFFGIKWAVQSGGAKGPSHGENALEVLKRRYAAGEISREQYLDMKKDLEN